MSNQARIAVYILCASSVLLSFFFYGSLRARPAMLAISPTILDLGTVAPGKVTRALELHNQFDVPIYIDQVIYGCSCTSVAFKDHALNPRESTIANCLVNLEGHRGTFTTGFHILYRVGSRNGQTLITPTVNITVKMDNRVWMVPDTVEFIDGTSSVHRVEIASKDRSAVIRSVNTDNIAITASVIDGRYVDVKFDPTKWRRGNGRASIGIETSDEIEWNVILPITINGAQ